MCMCILRGDNIENKEIDRKRENKGEIRVISINNKEGDKNIKFYEYICS